MVWTQQKQKILRRDGKNTQKNTLIQNTEELYKNDLHDEDNHNGVITHLEPDILECEVKWALESISLTSGAGKTGQPLVKECN